MPHNYLMLSWMLLVILFSPLFTKGDEFEIQGFVQYSTNDRAPWISGIRALQHSFPKLALKRMFMSKSGVDVDVIARKIDCIENKTYTFNLRKTNRIVLPEGKYRLECEKYEISLAEAYGEHAWCIKPTPLIQAGSDSNAERKTQARKIRIMCYDKGTRICIRGRVLDALGNPIRNSRVIGQPLTLADQDYHQAIYRQTDDKGQFEFTDQPPASLDVASYYLLTGEITSPLVETGDKVFEFRVTVGSGTNLTSIVIPLISENNLPALRFLAEEIRSSLSDDAKDLLSCKEMAFPCFPISTNNVIYVGDIVLPEKGASKKKD